MGRGIIINCIGMLRRGQKGMVEPILIGAVGLGLSMGLMYLATKYNSSGNALQNQKVASSEAELAMARVAHAVAMNAILCAAPLGSARPTPVCYWNPNPNILVSDFGFDPVSTTPTQQLPIVANACVPKSGSAIEANNCIPAKVKLTVELIDISGLRSSGILGGIVASGDNDNWGIKISTTTTFTSDQTDSKTGNLAQAQQQSYAIVRRPRMFVHFTIDGGSCLRQCTATNSLRTDSTPCVGAVQSFNDGSTTTGSNINVTMVNDGPGHLHHFTIQRTFIPNPDFAPPGAQPIVDTVYDSASGLPNGLDPGGTASFVDSGTPCYIQQMFNTVVSANGAGTTSATVSASRKVSGEVYYQLLTDQASLDPANVLYLSSNGGTVQAQQRTVTQIVAPAPPQCPNPSDVYPACCSTYPTSAGCTIATCTPGDPTCTPTPPCAPGDPTCTGSTPCVIGDPTCPLTNPGGFGGDGGGGGGGGGCNGSGSDGGP